MANGIKKLIEAVAYKVRRLTAGSPFQGSTRFKGELGVQLIKRKKR